MYPRFQLFHPMMAVSSRRLAFIVHHTFFFHVPLRNSYSSHSITFPCAVHSSPGGGVLLRFELDRGVPLEPQNPYPSLRVILAEKGTHF